MGFLVDARGLSCPEPVILVKRALEEHEEIDVLVDNQYAAENIKNLAEGSGFKYDLAEESGVFRITIKRKGREEKISARKDQNKAVIVICSDSMGRGDEKLGRMLLRAYVHALTEIDEKPKSIVFYNRGVLLFEEGSDYLQDLKLLQESGVELVLCGTCVNYFGLSGKIEIGIVSNMYDIAERLLRAEKIVVP